MAQVPESAGQHTAHENQPTILNADAGDRLALPSSDFVADAKMTRDGDDLVLQNAQGDTVVIDGYFSVDPAPLLTSPDGAVLTPKLVDSFLSSGHEYAARGTANDESPVGAVQEVKGHATVTHVDGTKETITIGTAIYQGDVIETDAQGAVNITFIDETTMAVSENARFAVDNYNYDPATESGTTNFSVLRGLFVFTSGLIGRDDPDDVKIETPVGSIGIRGTIIAGQINPHGESNITVLEGAIVVTNGMGETTLSKSFETVKVMGYDVPMHEMGVVPANDIMARFGTVSTVAPTLFTSINDSAAEQLHSQDGAPAQNAAPQEQPNSSGETTAPTDTQSTAPTNDGATTNTAPAPLAPPPADMGTMDMSGSTMTTGLPTTTTTMGQPTTTVSGTGMFDPALQIQPVVTTTTTTTSTGGTPQTTTGTTSTQTTTGGTTTLSPVLAPPIITGGAASGPAVTFTLASFSDISVGGTLVGHIDTGVAGTTYNFLSGTGDFTFVANGTGYDVFLNTTGSTKLLSSINTAVLQTISVDATLPTGTVLNNSFVATAQNANGLNTFDIDNPTARVAHIGDGGATYDAGYTISALGDINNDGFDDIVFSNNTSAAGQNHSYILYGGSSVMTSTNIPSIVAGGIVQNGINLVSNPTGPLDSSESKVSGIGDFNGDGVEDYIVGQAYNGPSVSNVGQVSIIDGSTHSSLALFSGTGGSLAGASVSGVGDINNDGFADAVFGAPGVDKVYLYQGTNSVATATSQTGITSSSFGTTVEGIGDFNGDGYNDFVVGAPSETSNNGSIYLYKGSTGGGFVQMSMNSGSSGSAFGSYLSSVGDINGDGYSDFYAGDAASAGKIYMGNPSGLSTNINFNFSSTPYTVTGVGSTGDFNGDGFDDFVISLADSGETHAFMVFGKGTGLPTTLNLTYLKNGANAIEYTFNTANNGDRMDITSVGDLNGDGYDDFAIGTYDVNGSAAGTGGMTLIYGHSTAGTPASAHVGTAGNDSFGYAGSTVQSFHTGAGHDVISLGNTSFLNLNGSIIDGGTGDDTIKAMGNLDFTNVNYEKMSGIEGINFGANNETITLTMENLFNLMKTSDSGILKIGLESGVSGANSQLVIADTNTGADAFTGTANTVSELQSHLQSNTSGSVGVSTPPGYNLFTIGGYQLMIDDSIVVDAQ